MSFLLALLVALYPCPIKRDAAGHIIRSKATLHAFLRLHGVTSAPWHMPKDSVGDHIIPLCACGSDTPENMQMQGIKEAKAKDVLERRACYKLAHALAVQPPVAEEVDSVATVRPIP